MDAALNNQKLTTGMIVKISNAFFKAQNGFFLVTRSPEDPCLYECTKHELLRVNSNGKLSKAKSIYNHWPLEEYGPYIKTTKANSHNAQHAKLEVVSINNQGAIEYFKEKISQVEWDIRKSEYLKLKIDSVVFELLDFYTKTVKTLETQK